MNKKHILQLSKYYSPYKGGIESVVLDISEGLVKYGFDTTVLATDESNLERVANINGVRVIRSKEYTNIANTSLSPRYFVDTIIKCNQNIIHIHLPNPLSNLALFLAWILGKDISNIVIHWHCDIVKQKSLLFLYRPLQNWLLRKSKVIIVTSSRYLNHSKPLRSFRYKTEVVPIGIDSLESSVDKFIVENIKSKYYGEKIVFSLGRHIYYKGFEFLIEAAPLVKNTVFLIGGIGPDTEKYKKMIVNMGLQDKVFLIGKVADEELPSYYSAADIFCFPSIEKNEAFGVSQLESMSVGTPVISTDIKGSGVPWVNKHMESGLICKPKNSKRLAQAINTLISDESLLNKLAYGAKNRFLSKFTKNHMVEKVVEIYNAMN